VHIPRQRRDNQLTRRTCTDHHPLGARKALNKRAKLALIVCGVFWCDIATTSPDISAIRKTHVFLVPERTRLFRLLKTHQDRTRAFLAAPTVLGVIDTYGIELIHPRREGRSPQQIGRKGLSNHRWIVGGKLCLLLNQWGLIVGWACDTANAADNTFQWLIQQVDGRMIVLSDTGFHAAEGDPSNLKLCQRGEWQDRLLVETVLSMLTLVAG
jgi:hypothetical protein